MSLLCWFEQEENTTLCQLAAGSLYFSPWDLPSEFHSIITWWSCSALWCMKMLCVTGNWSSYTLTHTQSSLNLSLTQHPPPHTHTHTLRCTPFPWSLNLLHRQTMHTQNSPDFSLSHTYTLFPWYLSLSLSNTCTHYSSDLSLTHTHTHTHTYTDTHMGTHIHTHTHKNPGLWTAHIMHIMIFWEAHGMATERAAFAVL